MEIIIMRKAISANEILLHVKTTSSLDILFSLVGDI